MTMDELYGVVDAAIDNTTGVAPKLNPVIHLNMRRTFGPVEIRLLLEAYATVRALKKAPSDDTRTAANLAHQAVEAMLESLPILPGPAEL